eukprot:1272394-Pyramimonas_sp.AAC.1
MAGVPLARAPLQRGTWPAGAFGQGVQRVEMDLDDDSAPAPLLAPEAPQGAAPPVAAAAVAAPPFMPCLLYTSDAADDTPCVDL